MRKLSLTFPQQITQQLCLLCLNQPKICKKQGSLGWTSNDRIILVKKGLLQYYSLHPGFVQSEPTSLKPKYFKGAVRLDFIHEVNFLPKNKIKKTFLQIVFPKIKKIVKFPTEAQKDEDYADAVAQTQEQLQKWMFQFNMDVKEYIEAKRQEQKQKRRKNAKLVPLSPKELKMVDSNVFSPTQIIHKQSKEDYHESNIEEYVAAVQRTKSHLKTKAELAEEQALRKKKQKQKQMAEMMSSKNQSIQQTFSISTFWRQYFRYYQFVMRGQKEKQPLNSLLDNELLFLRNVEYFNTVAVKTVENYIDQRAIGWNGVQKSFEKFNYYQGLWLKIGGKELNQQFLVNYYLNDILYSTAEIKQLKFRIPLMSLIKYKGVKVLVMCDMPFSELQKSEVYNLIDQGFDLQLMGKIKEALDILQDILNVKSEIIEIEPKKKVAAPLGLKLKIFQYNFKRDKSQDQATLPNFYYLINPGIVFPLDFMAQRSSNQIQPHARLRPQLVAFYRDYYRGEDPQLLSQAFMTSSMNQEFKKHEDQKVIEASTLIQTYKIKELANRLNRIQLLFVDSYSIKTIFEQIGINMRYLHLLLQKIQLPYLRQHIIAQALARTIKKQFRNALHQLQSEQLANAQQFHKMKVKHRIQLINEKKEENQAKYRLMALDFLNLVFGNGQESKQFWVIVLNNCKEYFKIDSEFPPKIKHGLLLHSVLWHCGLKTKFPVNIPLFQTQQPFQIVQNVQFVSKVKTFDFPSFEIQKLFRSEPSLQNQVTIDLFKESSSKLIKLQLLFQSNLRFNFQTQISMSKLSNLNEYIQKIQYYNSFHPLILPHYLTNKSQHNFHKALQVLNFSLPQSHPLFISCYIEYSTILQKDLLKKTALLAAVKYFGEFHNKTTQLYSQMYHEGDSEYRVKAMRVGMIQGCEMICREMFLDCKYQSCLQYCLDQITKMNSAQNNQKLGAGNYQTYIKMLMQGLESAIKMVQLQKGIIISIEMSYVISSFKLRDHYFTYELFKKTLIIHLLLAPKKYFLYKMVMLITHIRSQHQKVQFDLDRCAKEVNQSEREILLEGLTDEYYQYQNHSNWIAFIFDSINRSFQYFNFLQDLFTNYQHHLQRYNNDNFKDCIGYLDIFIRIYGQQLFKTTLYDIKFD